MIILEDELIELAKLGSTKGIKGLLRIYSEDFLPLQDMKVVIKENAYNLYHIEKIDDNIIKLKGVDDIGRAKQLVNCKLYIFKKDLKLFNEPLSSQLIGLDVIYKKERIGYVDSVYISQYKILSIVTESKEYNIPFTDRFVEYRDNKIFLKRLD